MATDITIGGSGELFVGETKSLVFEILDGDPNDAASLPVDATGWDLHFVLRKKDNTADPAIIDNTAVVAGVFAADRAGNLQRATVLLTHAQLLLVRAATYRYSFVRKDSGAEDVINYGDCKPQKATGL